MTDILSQLEEIQGNVRSIKATWGNTIMTLDNIKTSLKADRQKAIDEAYQRGLDDGKARNEDGCVGCRYDDGTTEHSPCNYCCNAYSNQWIAKPCSDEIEVGDEVCFVFAGGETIEPFIVFSIKDDNGKKYYEGIQTSDGRWVSGGLKYFKTGRHFPQVAELLKAMKGGAE